MLTKPAIAVQVLRSDRPIFTHARFLPGSRLVDARCTTPSSPKAATSAAARSRNRSSASARTSSEGTTIKRSVLLGADYYDADDRRTGAWRSPRLGIGSNVVLDKVIVDKNARVGDDARLVNEAGVEEADGDGYYIRNGVIIVPKDGVIKPGTVV